jgi:hypothetical protein
VTCSQARDDVAAAAAEQLDDLVHDVDFVAHGHDCDRHFYDLVGYGDDASGVHY